jgi:hypothetical protein
MKYFQKQRLLKLADFLESLPRGRFDLSIIGKHNSKGELPTPTSCGTAACAIGWTPVVFPRHCCYTACFYGKPNELSVASKETGERDFGFAEPFFGLDSSESAYLFMPDSYPKGRRGKKSVVDRIRKFVSGNVSREEIENCW